MTANTITTTRGNGVFWVVCGGRYQRGGQDLHPAKDILYAIAGQQVGPPRGAKDWGHWLDLVVLAAHGVQQYGFGPNHHCGHQHVGQRGHTERRAGITANGSVPGSLLHVGHDQPGRWGQRGGQQRDVQRDDTSELRVHVDWVHRGQCQAHQSGQRCAIHRAGDDSAGRYGHEHGGKYCAGRVLQRGDRAGRSHHCAVRVYVEQRADGQLCPDRSRR